MKKMKCGHLTGYNLLPTYADGIISPDILSIVHKMKYKTTYLKQIVPQQHILRAFQRVSANSRYTERILCRNDQTRHSYLVPRAALRKMTPQNVPIGPKVNSDSPQRTPILPEGHKLQAFM
jgi:hypothetical protein